MWQATHPGLIPRPAEEKFSLEIVSLSSRLAAIVWE
jgi:hypothetical protein